MCLPLPAEPIGPEAHSTHGGWTVWEGLAFDFHQLILAGPAVITVNIKDYCNAV